MFSFVWSMVRFEQLFNWIEYNILWSDICSFLNVLLRAPDVIVTPKLRTTNFPSLEPCLFEDFAMRGQLFAL